MIRVGLMGSGRIAQVHAAVLNSGVLDGIEIAGVCDVRSDRAAALSQRVDVPAYPGLSEMLAANPAIDVVAVLTESGNHGAHVSEVLRSGRHAIVEKPATLSVTEIDELIALSDSDRRVSVVHQNRFKPAVKAVSDGLLSDCFGSVVNAAALVSWGRPESYYALDDWRGTRKLDGGVVANQGVHHLDLLVHFFGPVLRASAIGTNAKHKLDCEDTLSAVLEFNSGVIAVFQVTTATDRDYEGSLTITGTQGYVRLSGPCLNQIEHWSGAQPMPIHVEPADYSALGIPSLYGFGHVDYYRDFTRAIRDSRPFCCDLNQARETAQAMAMIYRSAAPHSSDVFA